jgi:hypothetical protein
MRKSLLLLFVLSLFVLYGCGKNEQKPEDKKNVQTEVKTENKSVEQNQTDNDNKKSTENELGLKTGLPADFPKDVPQPPNSTCVGSIVNQTEGTTVTYTSKSKVMELTNFYKEEMKKNSYQVEAGMEELMNEKGGMIKWNKAGKEVELMMSFNSEQNATDIVLSYKDKK